MPAPKGNKFAEGCEDSGRPTKYKPEFTELTYKLCLLGATDDKIADILDVDVATINRWKNSNKEFCDALTRGKDLADAEIAKSLYHRAKGYEHPETITATYQGQITDTMEVIKHYPPDTPAATLWLKNRQPSKWRDKVETEITGKDGGAIIVKLPDELE